ncbi:thiamine pyrophosphate-dependent enzyme [Rhodopseudomonas sp. RCAM05734]|uniref:thiamine pyrophosphate-dependent enzyme n=1 Tax=Rhodopseudomonas sp. RCAM05734 TaxID=3457549 RepID=UPI004043FC06
MSTTDIAAPAAALTAHDFHSGATPIWCPGCGDYGVLSALEHALATHGRPPHEVVMVSGIGCSSRLPAYTGCYGFHGVHGRALPFASGVKLARPDLEVIAVGGDGDGYSIGGNHFIHACRRNIDMLYLVMDNRVYGMTKGQPSPTTEADWDSDIAPGGLGLRPFDPIALALAAGANFVARGFAGRSQELANLIVEGIRWPGFAFIEVLSPCMAFRSEAFGWKENVHPTSLSIVDDRAAAQAATLADDGYSLGLLFKDHRPSLPRSSAPLASLADVEEQFRVCG